VKGKTICLYSPPGSGKTTAGATLVGSGGVAFLYNEDGADPARRIFGFDARRAVVHSARKVTAALKPGVPFYLIDDLNYMIDDDTSGVIGYTKLNKIADIVGALGRACVKVNEAGGHVVIIVHERAMKFQDDPEKPNFGIRLRRGGPKISGNSAEDFAGLMQAIGRMVPVEGKLFWKYWIDFGTSDDFIARDRGAVGTPVCPGHLGELLRAQGYEIAWPADLTWIDKVADQIMQDLNENPEQEDVFKSWAAKLAKDHKGARGRIGYALFTGYARTYFASDADNWVNRLIGGLADI